MKSLVSLAVVFVIGVVLGVTGSNSKSAEAPAEPVAKTVTGPIADAGTQASLDALRSRVKDLEAQLAAKAEPTEEKVAEEKPEERGPKENDWRAGIEQFKKDHPEEYAKMEEQRKNFMQRRQERSKSQLDFLASVDTSKMTPEAKKTHERLMSLMAKRQEFESKITPEAVMNATDEERREAFETMRETEHEMRRLREEERSNLMRVTAQEMGFSGAEADAVVDTIAEIYEVTSGGFGPGGMFGGPGNGRGRGNGRGGHGGGHGGAR